VAALGQAKEHGGCDCREVGRSENYPRWDVLALGIGAHEMWVMER